MQLLFSAFIFIETSEKILKKRIALWTLSMRKKGLLWEKQIQQFLGLLELLAWSKSVSM